MDYGKDINLNYEWDGKALEDFELAKSGFKFEWLSDFYEEDQLQGGKARSREGIGDYGLNLAAAAW